MGNKVSNQQLEALQTGDPAELKLTVAIPAPTNLEPALAGVAGNVDNGDHRYKVTFVLDGETTLGGGGDPITVTDKTVDGQVDLTQIPLGPFNTSARKVYRTEADGSVYKLLTTIEDNTTTEFTDNTADASLGAEAPTVNTTKQTMLEAESGNLQIYAYGNVLFEQIGLQVLDADGNPLASLTVTSSGAISLRAEGAGITFEGTTLPTVDPEVAGNLWNEDGFVRISAG